MYWNYSTDFNSAETTWNYNRKIVVMWCGLNSETLSLQSSKRKVSPLSILKSSEECQSWDETLHVFDVRHWKELLIAIGRATTMIRRQSRLRKVFADQLGSIPGSVHASSFPSSIWPGTKVLICGSFFRLRHNWPGSEMVRKCGKPWKHLPGSAALPAVLEGGAQRCACCSICVHNLFNKLSISTVVITSIY